jgi:hypothetical protein
VSMSRHGMHSRGDTIILDEFCRIVEYATTVRRRS